MNEREIQSLLRRHCYFTLGHLVKIPKSQELNAREWLRDRGVKFCLPCTVKLGPKRSSELLERIEDLSKEHHGLDIEDHIMRALEEEITFEIDDEIVESLGYTVFRYFYFLDEEEALLFKLAWGA